MKDNEKGIIDDIDSEFLHDFRVAVRRTRSLLGQIRYVLPKRRVTRFKRDFAWLGEVTGPARDMDVYLLSFNDIFQPPPQASAKGQPARIFAGRQKMGDA